MIFSKIKLWLLGAFAAFIAGASCAFAVLTALRNKKERDALRKTLKQQQAYTTEKEKIAHETNAKLDLLSGADTDSFNTGIGLLHEAAND